MHSAPMHAVDMVHVNPSRRIAAHASSAVSLSSAFPRKYLHGLALIALNALARLDAPGLHPRKVTMTTTSASNALVSEAATVRLASACAPRDTGAKDAVALPARTPATDTVHASQSSSSQTITLTTLMMASLPFSSPTRRKPQTVTSSVPSTIMPGMLATTMAASVTMVSVVLTALLSSARPLPIPSLALASTQGLLLLPSPLSLCSSETSRDATVPDVESATIHLVSASASPGTTATSARRRPF